MKLFIYLSLLFVALTKFHRTKHPKDNGLEESRINIDLDLDESRINIDPNLEDGDDDDIENYELMEESHTGNSKRENLDQSRVNIKIAPDIYRLDSTPKHHEGPHQFNPKIKGGKMKKNLKNPTELSKANSQKQKFRRRHI